MPTEFITGTSSGSATSTGALHVIVPISGSSTGSATSAGILYSLEGSVFDNYGSWSYSAKFTIPTTSVGADHDNFIAHISLDTLLDASNGSFIHNVIAAGDDIRVVAHNQYTELNYYLEDWDLSSHRGWIMAKIPHVSNSTDTNFYVIWGNSGASAKSTAFQQATWSEYAYSIPLNSHTSLTARNDSTLTFPAHASNTTMAASDVVDGPTGKAFHWPVTDTWYDAYDKQFHKSGYDSRMNQPATGLTFSWWWKPPESWTISCEGVATESPPGQTNHHRVQTKFPDIIGTLCVPMRIWESGSDHFYHVEWSQRGSTGDYIQFTKTRNTCSTQSNSWNSNNGVYHDHKDGGWHLYTCIIDSTFDNISFYVDGVSYGTTAITVDPCHTMEPGSYVIGGRLRNTAGTHTNAPITRGSMADISQENVVRNSSWALDHFNMIDDQVSFYTTTYEVNLTMSGSVLCKASSSVTIEGLTSLTGSSAGSASVVGVAFDTADNPLWTYYGEWDYSMKLTIPLTSVNADHREFIAYIDCDQLDSQATSGFYSKVLQNGQDVRVVGENQYSELNFWLEDFDPENSRGWIMVKLREASSTRNVDFYILWGNAGASKKSDAFHQATWSNSFYSVSFSDVEIGLPVDEFITNDPRYFLYSRNGDPDLFFVPQGNSMVAGDIEDAIVGKGYNFTTVDTQSSNRYFTTVMQTSKIWGESGQTDLTRYYYSYSGIDAYGKLVNTRPDLKFKAPRTFSWWHKVPSSYSLTGTAISVPYFSDASEDAAEDMSIYVEYSSDTVDFFIRDDCTSNNTGNTQNSSTGVVSNYEDDSWHFYSVTIYHNGTNWTMETYVDGTAYGANTMPDDQNTNLWVPNIRIGNRTTTSGAQKTYGTLTELVVENTQRNSSWNGDHYSMVTDQANFYTWAYTANPNYQPSTPYENFPDWENAIKVTIPTTSVCLSHTEFIAYVDCDQLDSTAPSGFYASTNAGGTDIRVVSSNFVDELYFWLEDFDKASSRGWIMVYLPSVSTLANTEFYVIWGNTGASAKSSSFHQTTWANLVGSFAFDSHTSVDSRDGNTGFVLSGSGTSALDVVDGIVGKAYDFQDTGEYFNITPYDEAFVHQWPFTYSWWYKVPSGQSGQILEVFNTIDPVTDSWLRDARIIVDASSDVVQFRKARNDVGTVDSPLSNTGAYTNFDDDGWHYYTVVLDPFLQTITFAIDGTSYGVIDLSTPTNFRPGQINTTYRQPDNFRVGDSSIGALCEFLIEFEERSLCWSGDTYDMVSSQGTFYTLTYIPNTIAGSSAGTSTATAVVFPVGLSEGSATSTATIQGTGYLTGSADGSATSTAVLQGQGYVVGSSSGSASSSGTINGTGYLTGLASGSATSTGVLVGSMLGTSSAGAIGSGVIFGLGSLTGASTGTSVGSGVLQGKIYASGVANGVATSTGNIMYLTKGVGLSAGTCTVVGVMTGETTLIGLSSGVATAVGVLCGKLSAYGGEILITSGAKNIVIRDNFIFDSAYAFRVEGDCPVPVENVTVEDNCMFEIRAQNPPAGVGDEGNPYIIRSQETSITFRNNCCYEADKLGFVSDNGDLASFTDNLYAFNSEISSDLITSPALQTQNTNWITNIVKKSNIFDNKCYICKEGTNCYDYAFEFPSITDPKLIVKRACATICDF